MDSYGDSNNGVSGDNDEEKYYVYGSDGWRLKDANGELGEVSTLDDPTIIEIKYDLDIDDSYRAYANLKKIIVSDGKVTIKKAAFFTRSSYSNSSIREVEVKKDGILTIEDNAFFNSKIEKLIFDGTVTIGNQAFKPLSTPSSLDTIKFGDSSIITFTGNSIFDGSLVKSVDLSRVSFGTNATGVFRNCIELESVSNIPTTIPNSTFSGCKNLKSVLDLSEVESIGSSAFANTSITEIDLKNVKTIGNSSFQNCTKLNSVINYNFIEIPNSCFEGCTSLLTFDVKNITKFGNKCLSNSGIDLSKESISIISGISVGANAFNNINIGTIIIQNGAKLSENAFADSSISTLILDNSSLVSSSKSGKGVFKGSNIETAIINSNVGNYLFTDSNIKKVELKNTTIIGNNAFQNCRCLTEINFNNVSDIGSDAFKGCTELNSVVDLTNYNGNTIQSSTFNGCTKITEVLLSNTIKKIDSNAFLECINLSSITNLSNIETISSNCFKDCKKLGSMGTLSLDSLKTLYGNAFNGCGFEDNSIKFPEDCIYNSAGCTCQEIFVIPEIEFPDGTALVSKSTDGRYILHGVRSTKSDIDLSTINIVQVSSGVFKNSDFTTITFGSGLKTIDPNAFEKSTNLISVTWDDSVVSIGSYAFSNCSALKEIGCNNEIKGSIGSNSFSNCVSLETIKLTCKSIENYAFRGCVNLAFDNGVLELSNVKIGGMAFSNTAVRKVVVGSDCITSVQIFLGCSQLSEVVLNNIRTISSSAFENTGITSLIVPDGVVINSLAFSGCSKLTNLTLGSGVSVGAYAFSICEELENIKIGSGVTIGDNAFQNCVSLIGIGPSGDEDSAVLTEVKCVGKLAFQGCISLTSIVVGDSLCSQQTVGSAGKTVAKLPLRLSWDAFQDCSSIGSYETDGGSRGWVSYSGSDTRFMVEGDLLLFDGMIVLICPSAESISIPSYATGIMSSGYEKGIFSNDDSAISSSTSLRSIYVDSGNGTFISICGALADKDRKIIAVPCSSPENGLLRIEAEQGYSIAVEAFRNVAVSDLELIGVLSIASGAFSDCAIQSISIDASSLDYDLQALSIVSKTSLDTLIVHATGDVKISGVNQNIRNVEIKTDGNVDFTNAFFYIEKSDLESLSVVAASISWNHTMLSKSDKLDSISLVADDIVLPADGKLLDKIGTDVTVNLSCESLRYTDGIVPSTVVPNISKAMMTSWAGHYGKIIAYNETYGFLQALPGTCVYYVSEVDGAELIDFRDGSFKIITSEGHAPGDLNVSLLESTCIIDFSDGIYTIRGYSADSEYTILIKESEDDGPWVEVSFDSGCEVTVPSIKVSEGHTLLKTMLPVPERRGFAFGGWYIDSDLTEEYKHDANGQIYEDTVLYAKWISEGDYLDVDASAGLFYVKDSDGKLNEYKPGSFTGAIELVFKPYTGFILIGYYLTNLDDSVVQSDSSLRISSVNGYACIVPNVKYISSSTDLEYVVERDTPKQSDSLVLAWSFDGGKVVQSGMVWSGMPSVPLIVDDRVYIQANDQIFCVDAETGATIRVIETGVSTTAFYHYLGYGGGYIVDYTSKKIFDEDLEEMCSIPEGVRYLVWHEIDGSGAFYGIVDTGESKGKACKLIPNDGKAVLVNQFENAPTVNVFQELNGTVSHAVVVGNIMYYISVNGKIISINALNLATGDYGTKVLSRLTGYYLDDGWLTAYNGYLYITAYTSGLFGTSEVSGKPLIGCMKIDGTDISEPSYIEVDAGGYNSLTSALVIQNGRGYLNVTKTTTHLAKFLVYNIDAETGMPVFEKSIDSVSSHGSLVASTYNYDPVSRNGEVYIYLLNYSSSQFLYIFKDVCVNGEWTLSDTVAKKPIEPGFGSQAVRVGTEGQLIFYNDSGKVYCYGTPEFASSFGFLVDDGDTADIRIGDGVETDAQKALEKAIADAFGVRKATVNLVDGTVVVAGKTYYVYYIDSDGQAASLIGLGSDLSKVKTFYLSSDESPKDIDPDKVWWSSYPNDGTSYRLGDVVPELRSFKPMVLVKTGVAWGYGDSWVRIIGGGSATISFEQQTDGSYLLSGGVSIPAREGYVLRGFTDGADIYRDGDVYQMGERFTTLNAVWDKEVESISINTGSKTLEIGETFVLKASPSPSDAIISGGLVWSSSNPAVAVVSSNGVVTAVSAGKALITVTTADGRCSATCVVTVEGTATSIALDRDTLRLEAGTSAMLRASTSPDSSSGFEWTTSDPSVAVVDGGRVTGIAPGTATISVRHGDLTATCIVTVYKNGDVKTDVVVDEKTGNTVTRTEETSDSGSSTVTKNTETTTDKDGNHLGTVISVDAETDDGNVRTVATVKKDSDGNILESTIDVKVSAEVSSSNGKQTITVSRDDLLAAMDQIEAVRSATGQDIEPVIAIDVGSKGSAASSTATIPSDVLGILSDDEDAVLELKTSAGTIGLTSDVMSKLSTDGEDVKLGITKVPSDGISQETRDIIGDAHLFELSAVTGTTEHHLLGGRVLVSLPYTLGRGADPDDVRVYHMDDSGALVPVECEYDPETGEVSFVTDHFSYFVVSEKALTEEPGADDRSDDGFPMIAIAAAAALVVVIAIVAVIARRSGRL